jgi:hypothetical protein
MYAEFYEAEIFKTSIVNIFFDQEQIYHCRPLSRSAQVKGNKILFDMSVISLGVTYITTC